MSRQYCIGQAQRNLHVGTEAIAVLAITPALAMIARTEGPLNKTQKGILWAIAIGTSLFDGLLLSKWIRQGRGPRAPGSIGRRRRRRRVRGMMGA